MQQQQVVQVQYVAPVPQAPQNDIVNYPFHYIHNILSWGVDINENTATLEWKRGYIRKTLVVKTAKIESVLVHNIRFVSLFYLLTSFRLKPAYLWGAFFLLNFVQWVSVWITFSTTQSTDGIRFAACMGIFSFIIVATAPIFFKLAGVRRITNQTHILLYVLLGVLAFAQFFCACAFLNVAEPGGNTNPGLYFLILTCKPITEVTPHPPGGICSEPLYGWAVAMTVISFISFIVSIIAAKETYFLWGSAFLAHPGLEPICRVTFIGKAYGRDGLPESIVLREADAHEIRRIFTDYISGRKRETKYK